MKKTFALLVSILFFAGAFIVYNFAHASTPVILPVPFTPQAPEGRWVEPWDNACEETSLVMVESYYRGNWSLDVAKSKKEIENVLAQKEALSGKSRDESPDLIVEMIKKTYNRNAWVEKDITLDKIKHQIDGGYPVIMAFDTRLVKNSNFIRPKPTYHVAALVGYDDEKQQFIVNDPGTSDGEHFRYGYEEFLNANKTYTVRDTGEVRGSDAVFTSSVGLNAQGEKGFLTKVFEYFRIILN